MVLEDSHWTNTDPWSILYEPCPDVKQLSPGSSLGWTWDQSLMTVEINTITLVMPCVATAFVPESEGRTTPA